jgi:hypothetical protein
MKRKYIILIGAIVALAAAVLFYIFFVRPDLSDQIVVPYIAHQKPTIDPHLPGSEALSDKLDEVQFDGLFNLSANPSGVIYEDGLGELVGMDNDNVVSVKLKTNKVWHDTYQVKADDDKLTISKGADHLFSAKDLNFSLKRIQSLGSLSPDYILVSQAVDDFAFEGPDRNDIVRFKFRGDRIWKEADIKEVLSFKILPDGSPMNALNYRVGTAAYLALPPKEGVADYYKNPAGGPIISHLILAPFVDNSTYPTEIKNGDINVLLDTPFGSLSPILEDSVKFFTKSNISATFFALVFNTERLSRDQRRELRKLLNTRQIVDLFFKVNTPQQRNIVDYKGNRNNYGDYINLSVFPSSSYYIEEEIIEPQPDEGPAILSVLPDTVKVQACLNYGFREEYTELINILNNSSASRGRLKVTAVTNEEVRNGSYDALLIAFSGYRSNFLFDLYNVFLREPNLEAHKINLVTMQDEKGNTVVSPASLQAAKNFFRLEARSTTAEHDDIALFLQYLYSFMSTRQIGDKQEYARRIDELEQRMCLGKWLFSLPSLAYFSTQFDSSSIDLYGMASQLSTIKKWKEQPKR